MFEWEVKLLKDYLIYLHSTKGNLPESKVFVNYTGLASYP